MMRGKWWVSIVFVLLAGGVYAEDFFPQGCKPVMLKKSTLTRLAEQPALIVLHNLSEMDVWITHPVSDANFEPWSSRVRVGGWSALVLNANSFELGCIESRPGHEQQVPCEEVLGICQWAQAVIPAGKKKTYWAAEDMKLSALTAYMGRQGFELPA